MSRTAQYRLDSPVILAQRQVWNTPGSLLTRASGFLCVQSGADMLVDIPTQIWDLVMTWRQFLQCRYNLSLSLPLGNLDAQC